jgi:hypothetical protein
MTRTISPADALAIVWRHQKISPVRLNPIAHDLGLKVYSATFSPDISGKIVRSSSDGGSSGYAIYINAAHAHVRQRFTLAHEIAHFILHRDEIGDGLTDDGLYRSGLSNKLEAQANKLATDILMPWPLINDAIDNGIDSIPELAKHFDVSRSAMSIRIGVPYETAA